MKKRSVFLVVLSWHLPDYKRLLRLALEFFAGMFPLLMLILCLYLWFRYGVRVTGW